MRYNLESYKTLAERFNKMSFLQKVITVKQQDIFILESDAHGNLSLRLDDFDAMNSELDMLFQFPEQLSGSELKTIFELSNIKLKIV